MTMEMDPAFAKEVQALATPQKKKGTLVTTRGLTDEVLNAMLQVVGHVGYHEIDEKPHDIEAIAQKAANDLDTMIAVIETNAGYHLISFEIMDDTQWDKWMLYWHNNLPGDYPDNICDQDLTKMNVGSKDGLFVWLCPNCGRDYVFVKRILRISAKGDIPAPKIKAWKFPKSQRMMELSDKHVLIYQQQKIIDKIPYPNFKMMHTWALAANYETREENK